MREDNGIQIIPKKKTEPWRIMGSHSFPNRVATQCTPTPKAPAMKVAVVLFTHLQMVAPSIVARYKHNIVRF